MSGTVITVFVGILIPIDQYVPSSIYVGLYSQGREANLVQILGSF